MVETEIMVKLPSVKNKKPFEQLTQKELKSALSIMSPVDKDQLLKQLHNYLGDLYECTRE